MLEYNPEDPNINADPFPVFRRLRDEPLEWIDSLTLRGLKRLPIRFEP